MLWKEERKDELWGGHELRAGTAEMAAIMAQVSMASLKLFNCLDEDDHKSGLVLVV